MTPALESFLALGGLGLLALPWEEREDGADWPGSIIAGNVVHVQFLGDSFSSGYNGYVAGGHLVEWRWLSPCKVACKGVETLLAIVIAVDSTGDGHGFPRLAATPWRIPSSFSPPPFSTHLVILQLFQRVSGYLGGDRGTGTGRRPGRGQWLPVGRAREERGGMEGARMVCKGVMEKFKA